MQRNGHQTIGLGHFPIAAVAGRYLSGWDAETCDPVAVEFVDVRPPELSPRASGLFRTEMTERTEQA
jgi:hypothetical protein